MIARAKITLAVIAPVVGLVALFLIASSSGSADADRAAVVQTPVVTASAALTLNDITFSNQWSNLFPAICATPAPTPPAGRPVVPTATPNGCPQPMQITFTNHWIS